MATVVLVLQMLAGIWLIASPAVFTYVGTAASINDRVTGPFIATFAVVAMGDATRNVRWWNIPLAVWMLIALGVFDYPGKAIPGIVAAMAIVIAAPFWPRTTKATFGGGWPALFRKDPYDTKSGSADAPANPSGVAGR